jgi:hypothetical protein
MLLSVNEQFEKIQKQKEMEERSRFPLEQRIRERIVGQEGAITTVASGMLKLHAYGMLNTVAREGNNGVHFTVAEFAEKNVY